MPEHIRSYLFVLIFSTLIFLLTKSTAVLITTGENFSRRCILWLGLTSIIFITHSMFLYLFLAGSIILFTTTNEKNKVALFFFFFLALPFTSVDVPAFGLVNFLFTVDPVRFLEIIILLPLFFKLLQKKDSIRFLKMTSDKYIFAYLLWTILLLFLTSTLTNTLRFIFYVFIDIFLPYYVISRSLKNTQDFKDALFSFVVSCSVIAIIGIFEFFKSWLLYNSLTHILGVSRGIGDYLRRGDSLRVMASTGYPLVFGYLLVICLGFFLVIQKHITNRIVRGIWLAIILVALIASQARGPWVGAIVMIFIFILTGTKILPNLFALTIAGGLTFGGLAVTPFGEKIIRSLPFIGTSEQFNVTYRELLIENSLKLVLHNPIFGVPNVLEELKGMKQGEGIVDIVNTYVGIALSSGLVGLILFLSFFVTITFGIYKAMRSIVKINDELHLIGRSLLGSLIAILIMIGTVSSVSFIPVTYWSVAGLGLAYIHIVRRILNDPKNIVKLNNEKDVYNDMYLIS